MTSLFNLEGAIIEKAHSSLRTKIVEAMKPMRALVDTLSDVKRHQDFRIAFDKFEHQLFAELRGDAEKEMFDSFVATYDQVAAIVNAAKEKEKGHDPRRTAQPQPG